jgi:signal transduction histidine kinase
MKEGDMNALLQDVASFMSAEAEHRSIEIKLDLCPDLPRVAVDGEKFKWQVIVNLIKNAFDAMPDGGRLTIKSSLRRDKEGPVSRPPSVLIDVSDNGHGIAPEIRDRIFEPFFSTKEKGTGLGLAIVFRTVEAHGGTISVSSQEERGSTFTIAIPVTNHQEGGI